MQWLALSTPKNNIIAEEVKSPESIEEQLTAAIDKVLWNYYYYWVENFIDF